MSDPIPRPAQGLVVLDGFIQPGLTLVADSGSSSSRLTFGPSTEFDGGGFTLERDTVLAVSSRAAGDLLYVADLNRGTVKRVQLPARSNPAKARLLTGSGGQSRIGVALRDSNAIAFVTQLNAATPTITRVSNAGTCPTDFFVYDNATWIVDANANCRSDYTVLGDVRLIRVPNSGTARDTLLLPNVRGSSAEAIVLGDVAYVSAGGAADFASFPYRLIASGRIVKVDLRARRVLADRPMPAGTYGAGVKRGADGALYVSLYENLTTFANRVLRVRADDLSLVTSGGALFFSLTTSAGADVPCGSTTADALGRVHCLVSGAGSATSVVIFDLGGKELRRLPAGQGGVDLALR